MAGHPGDGARKAGWPGQARPSRRGRPTTYYLLPTTYYLLPTTYYLLPTAYCLLLGELGQLVGGKRQARQVERPLLQQLVDLLSCPLQQLAATGAPGRPAPRRSPIPLQGPGSNRPVGLKNAVDGTIDGEPLMEARGRDLHCLPHQPIDGERAPDLEEQLRHRLDRLLYPRGNLDDVRS